MNPTPAPWTPFILDMPLQDVPAYVDKCIKASSGADFYFIAGTDERGNVDIAHVGNGPRAAEHARLLAAAPVLLEACRRELLPIERRENRQFLRDAISLATGETAS